MGEHRKDLAEAEAFANKYCNPEDSEIISDLDRHARETAWALLQRIKHLEQKSCVCEECGSEVEDEPIEEQVTEEEVKVEKNKAQEVKAETPETSTMDKLSEIAEKNKDILDKAAKGTVAAAAAGATTQTASAATGLSAFVQETTQKIATIGVAGTMSIGSGAYFQAKTTKEKGTEIAVVAEQEHKVFSNLNDFTETTIGFQPFGGVTEAIVEYAEKGYGDVVGTSEEGYEGSEEGEGEGSSGEEGEGETSNEETSNEGEGNEGEPTEENNKEGEGEAVKEEESVETEEKTEEESKEEPEEEPEEKEESEEEEPEEEAEEEESEEKESEEKEAEEEESEEEEPEEGEKKKTDLEDSEETIELEEDDQVTQVPDVITR
ncbi:hypothetical protein OAG04_00100 [bacterium]|jgi:hypothetical protein|nr:hypothetical protein [bacterium]